MFELMEKPPVTSGLTNTLVFQSTSANISSGLAILRVKLRLWMAQSILFASRESRGTSLSLYAAQKGSSLERTYSRLHKSRRARETMLALAEGSFRPPETKDFLSTIDLRRQVFSDPSLFTEGIVDLADG